MIQNNHTRLSAACVVAVSVSSLASCVPTRTEHSSSGRIVDEPSLLTQAQGTAEREPPGKTGTVTARDAPPAPALLSTTTWRDWAARAQAAPLLPVSLHRGGLRGVGVGPTCALL